MSRVSRVDCTADSGDHVERLGKFAAANGKPFLLLLPDHFAGRRTYRQALGNIRPLLLVPRVRYHYWTPTGLRDEAAVGDGQGKGHCNLQLGKRNSPYSSHWHVHVEPLLSNAQISQLIGGGKAATAAATLRMFERVEDIGSWGQDYRNGGGRD